jgi:CTP:molybdopterin cytidylyltransferase MocA
VPAGDGDEDSAVTVAGLLLAAGSGRRFGRPKALVEFRGEPLVERGLRLLADGGCAPLAVVVGAGYAEILQQARLGGAWLVVNRDWEEGIASSLRTGLAALAEDADEAEAVVVALADQPLVGVEAVRRLRAAWEDGAQVALATYGGEPGNPVLLTRSVWAEATRYAQGDVGARALMRRRPELVNEVACDGTGAPDDIDTPEDLERLQAAST